MPRNKEQKAAYMREYRKKNKEKVAVKKKEYYEKNKEKVAVKNKEYYEANKEKLAERHKEWRENNKEYYKAYHKTEKGKKANRINGWKALGIVCDYDAIYDIYINTHHCNFCNKDFKNSLDRHLDHDHNTGDIRGILCRSCNTKDVLAINHPSISSTNEA